MFYKIWHIKTQFDCYHDKPENISRVGSWLTSYIVPDPASIKKTVDS